MFAVGVHAGCGSPPAGGGAVVARALRDARDAATAVLASRGGTAMAAAAAAARVLEGCPLTNAGTGAALTEVRGGYRAAVWWAS